MSFCAARRAKSWRSHCTKKLRSVISPDPLNARSLRLLEFPKSPPQKNPGSANAQTDGHTRLRYVDIVYITVGCPSVCPFVCLFIYSPIHIKKQNTTSQDTYTLKRIKQLSGLNGQHCPGDNSCRSIHICRRHKSASTSWQRQCCDPRRIDTKY